MPPILYYIPAARAPVDAADLVRVGLNGILDGASLDSRGVTNGPDECGGVVVTVAATAAGKPVDGRVGYFPAEQTWIGIGTKGPRDQGTKGGKGQGPGAKGPDSDSPPRPEALGPSPCPYWLGYVTHPPPGPGDLARPEQFGGHEVELNDGNKWLVPVARSFVPGAGLPEALILGPDGQLVREALPGYASISADAERVWQQMRRELGEDESAGGETMDETELWPIAVQALGLNYRVGPVEVSCLRLLTSRNVYRVVLALIDYPTVVKVGEAMFDAKKNADPRVAAPVTPDSSSTGDGDPANSETITPPSPTSGGLPTNESRDPGTEGSRDQAAEHRSPSTDR